MKPRTKKPKPKATRSIDVQIFEENDGNDGPPYRIGLVRCTTAQHRQIPKLYQQWLALQDDWDHEEYDFPNCQSGFEAWLVKVHGFEAIDEAGFVFVGPHYSREKYS